MRLKECNCEICRNSMRRVGYKKFRKWSAKFIQKTRKELKKLQDKGIKNGYLGSKNEDEVNYACLRENIEHAQVIYTECRLDKKHKNRH